MVRVLLALLEAFRVPFNDLYCVKTVIDPVTCSGLFLSWHPFIIPRSLWIYHYRCIISTITFDRFGSKIGQYYRPQIESPLALIPDAWTRITGSARTSLRGVHSIVYQFELQNLICALSCSVSKAGLFASRWDAGATRNGCGDVDLAEFCHKVRPDGFAGSW